jgi:hypothetical protein
MTHNLYVGADADAVLSNPMIDTIAPAFSIGGRNDFPARAAATAWEAASAAGGPLLIGLQEGGVCPLAGVGEPDAARDLHPR